MSGKVYIESLSEDVDADHHIVREQVADNHLWIVFVLDDGHEIRFQHDLSNVYANSATGLLDIRPESGNALRIKADRKGY